MIPTTKEMATKTMNITSDLKITIPYVYRVAFQQGIKSANDGWERNSPYKRCKNERYWYLGFDYGMLSNQHDTVIALKGTYYIPKVDLDLHDVFVDEENNIIQAQVINGAWTLKRDGNAWLALDFYGNIHNKWPYEQYFYEKKVDKREIVGNEYDDEDDIPF